MDQRIPPEKSISGTRVNDKILMGLNDQIVGRIRCSKNYFKLMAWNKVGTGVSLTHRWIITSTLEQAIITSNLVLRDWGYVFVNLNLKSLL